MSELTKQALSKVPAVTLGFWIILPQRPGRHPNATSDPPALRAESGDTIDHSQSTDASTIEHDAFLEGRGEGRHDDNRAGCSRMADG
jgi:hypothetical protein